MSMKRVIRKPVEPAGLCVTLDRRVELRRIERLIPRTKLGKLARDELLKGTFDFFDGGDR